MTRVVSTQVPIPFPLSLGPQDPLIIKFMCIKWIDLRSRNPAVFGLTSEGSFDVMLLMVVWCAKLWRAGLGRTATASRGGFCAFYWSGGQVVTSKAVHNWSQDRLRLTQPRHGVSVEFFCWPLPLLHLQSLRVHFKSHFYSWPFSASL